MHQSEMSGDEYSLGALSFTLVRCANNMQGLDKSASAVLSKGGEKLPVWPRFKMAFRNYKLKDCQQEVHEQAQLLGEMLIE